MAVIWRGDDLNAWSGSEVVQPDRIGIVPDVKRGEKLVRALRFLVKKNDYPPGKGTSGPRAELLRQDKRPEGTERYCAFSVMFPKGSFAVKEGSWQVFHQYHQGYLPDGAGGWKTIGRSPPVEFSIVGSTLYLKTNDHKAPDYKEKTHWSAPLEYDKWYDFILHAKWSSNPATGFLRLFLNGKEVVPRTPVATMFPGFDIYLKAGLYRKKDIEPDSVVYHRGYLETNTLDEALASQAPAVIAPTTPVVDEDSGWRVGRKLGTTIYRDGNYIATMTMGQTEEAKKLAQQICDAMNKKG